MNTLDFKTQIKNIRKEALGIGFSISTMDEYLRIWNKFIYWKSTNSFVYNEKDYIDFLLDYYKFDVNSYTNKSRSLYQQLMRSKRKRSLPSSLYSDYPSNWNVVLDNYLDYLKNVRQNSNNSIIIKKRYLINLLSYFYKNGLNELDNFSKTFVVDFINKTIDKGNISKRRNFYVLRDFLNYLFIEDIILEDLSCYIPKIILLYSKNKEK